MSKLAVIQKLEQKAYLDNLNKLLDDVNKNGIKDYEYDETAEKDFKWANPRNTAPAR